MYDFDFVFFTISVVFSRLDGVDLFVLGTVVVGFGVNTGFTLKEIMESRFTYWRMHKSKVILFIPVIDRKYIYLNDACQITAILHKIRKHTMTVIKDNKGNHKVVQKSYRYHGLGETPRK